MNEKSITFPFHYFLEEHCLGQLDSTPVKPYSGTLIQATDPKRELVYVQWKSLEHLTNYDSKNPPAIEDVTLEGEPFKLPIVWWRKAWDLHYPREVLKKIKSFDERKRNNITSENIARIAKWCKYNLCLPEAEAKKVATEMYKTPDKELLSKLGIYIE